VIDARSRWSFARLDEYASRFAAMLAKLGIATGDRVVFRIPNRVELAIGLLGCWKAGIIGVPVNFRLTGGEMQRVLDHCRPKLAVMADADEARPQGHRVLRYGADRHQGPFWDALAAADPHFASIGRQDRD